MDLQLFYLKEDDVPGAIGKKQDLIERVRGCISINKAVDPKVDDGNVTN